MGSCVGLIVSLDQLTWMSLNTIELNTIVSVGNWFLQITALHIVHKNKYCTKHFTF